MQLVEWFLVRELYYIMPNRAYWLLGANVIDSKGENEWYNLLDLLHIDHF